MSATPVTVTDVLRELTHRAVEDALGGVLRGAELRIQEQAPIRVGEVLSPHCTYGLVTGENIKILVKIHYSDASLRLASLDECSEDRRVKARNSLTKELCNVVSGKLKSSLADCGVVLGQSLPLLVDALDELISPVQSGYPDQLAWKAEWPRGSLVASFHWQERNLELKMPQPKEAEPRAAVGDDSGIELF